MLAKGWVGPVLQAEAWQMFLRPVLREHEKVTDPEKSRYPVMPEAIGLKWTALPRQSNAPSPRPMRPKDLLLLIPQCLLHRVVTLDCPLFGLQPLQRRPALFRITGLHIPQRRELKVVEHSFSKEKSAGNIVSSARMTRCRETHIWEAFLGMAAELLSSNAKAVRRCCTSRAIA